MGIDGFLGGLPWGFGNYGALHLQHLPYESTKHMIATGAWGMHAHNEFLDAGLDGGILAILLLVFMSILTVIRVWTIADPTMRIACQASGIAIFTHLMTDNTYGVAYGQFWMGIMLGIFWSTKSRVNEGSSFLNSLRRFPSTFVLALPLVLISAYGAVTSFYPSVLGRQPIAEERLAALKLASEPQMVNLLTLGLLLQNDITQEAKRDILDESVRKTGWNNLLVHEDANFYIKENSGSEAGIKSFVRFLQYEPFNRFVYNELMKYLERFPHTREFLPAEYQTRLSYLSGNPSLIKPDISIIPKDLYAAQDLYAALIWHLLNETSWSQIALGVKKLTNYYGNIPAVAQFAFETTREAPTGTFSWSDVELSKFTYGLERNPIELINIIKKVRNKNQALAIKGFLFALYPNLRHDFIYHTVSDSMKRKLYENDFTVLSYCETVRCFGLMGRKSQLP
jgi:hypothetical protein